MAEPGDRLRVLHLIKGLGPGGAEQLIVNQCRASKADDIAYEAAHLLPWKDHLVAPLAEVGVAVDCLRGGRRLGVRWLVRLRARLVDRPVDVVHVHSPLVAAATRLLVRTLRRSRRPLVAYTEHNRWPRHGRITRIANRATLALDDLDLAVSDEIVSSMPRRAARRFAVVTHGIDLAAVADQRPHRAAVRRELGFADSDVVVGIVANLRREKAYEVLIAAARRAVDAEPRLRYVAVGQGPLEAEVRDLAQRSGLGERFLLLGYRPDATRILSGCDVFTLSSRHEGLPVALMEALALGLPVAATRAGGVPIAVDDSCGLLVPVDDPAALAEAHLRLVDPQLRRDLAEGAVTVATRFDAARSTREIEQRYRALAASRRS